MPILKGYICDRCKTQDPGTPALEIYPPGTKNFIYCERCAKDLISVLNDFNHRGGPQL